MEEGTTKKPVMSGFILDWSFHIQKLEALSSLGSCQAEWQPRLSIVSVCRANMIQRIFICCNPSPYKLCFSSPVNKIFMFKAAACSSIPQMLEQDFVYSVTISIAECLIEKRSGSRRHWRKPLTYYRNSWQSQNVVLTKGRLSSPEIVNLTFLLFSKYYTSLNTFCHHNSQTCSCINLGY